MGTEVGSGEELVEAAGGGHSGVRARVGTEWEREAVLLGLLEKREDRPPGEPCLGDLVMARQVLKPAPLGGFEIDGDALLGGHESVLHCAALCGSAPRLVQLGGHGQSAGDGCEKGKSS